MDDRAEFEQRDLDLVEEAKLQKLDAQMAFNMRRSAYPGCPHARSDGEGPTRCSFNEMRVCCLESAFPQPCEIYGEILEEWRLEYEATNKTDALRSA